uniref:Ubiquitin-related modifier 1 homolog n=1 Tax=Globodera rostochiensis TaxID=31243 RepID=A0A914GV20_GLORO
MTNHRIKLEFAGGLDALFGGKRESEAQFSKVSRAHIFGMGNDRTEMLVQRDSVRPGVLVLVNDTDWEILGGLDAQLKDGDTVTFISTLHGG